MGPRFESVKVHQWPVGQVVKTEASHAFNIGSNPVRVTSSSYETQCSEIRKRISSPVFRLVASNSNPLCWALNWEREREGAKEKAVRAQESFDIEEDGGKPHLT